MFWEASECALKTITKSRQKWITVTAARSISCGTNIVKRESNLLDSCPRCNLRENPLHIRECQAPSAVEVWNNSVSELHDWMKSFRVQSTLADNIADRLRQWKIGSKDPIIVNELNIRTALHLQDSLGWHPFLQGILIDEWKHPFIDFLALTESKVSLKRWAASLIKKIWQISWDQWEHRNAIKFEENSQKRFNEIEINQDVIDTLNMTTTGLSPSEKSYVNQQPRIILSWPNIKKIQWNKAAREILKNRTTRDKIVFSQERHSMASWLNRD